MSWQYIVFTFMAGFPAVMWVVGQVMEQRSSHKDENMQEIEYNPSPKKQFMAFIAGITGIVTMLGLGIGAFGHTAFSVVGVISFASNLILFKKLGVFETVLKG